MKQRLLSLLACWCLTLVGCSGATATKAGGADAAAGAAGATDSEETGTLRPPVAIVDDPDSVGPSPAKCPGSPTPDPPIVRACVLATSCSPFPQATTVSDCIAKALPASGMFPECMLGAQSCAEMDACLGTGFYADSCASDQTGSVCVGTKVVTCNDIPRSFRDCAKSGASCARYSTKNDGVVDNADCAVTAKCTTASDVYVCDGTKRVRCQQGIGFGEDCAARGLACVAATGGAVCAQKVTPCKQPGTGSCEASGDGSYCGFDGRALSFECSRLGFACEPAPTSQGGVQCVAPACSTQAAAECLEECDGASAHLCLGGQRFSVDCRAYGLQDCILDTRAGAGDRARCGYD